MTSVPQPLAAASPALTQVAHHLSAPRLAPFLAATNSHVKDAVHLYGWNATQTDPESGMLLSSDWLLAPAPLLRRLTRGDIAKATAYASKAVRGRPNGQVLHADVLAQLSLGTWRFLLPDNDRGRQLLWSSALSKAFPHLRGSARSLTSQVEGIYRLRNRVAHLEPLLKTADVEHQVRNVSRVLNAISPPAASWVISQQRVTLVISQRP